MFLSPPPPLSPSPGAVVADNLSDQKSTRKAQESFPLCLWLKISLPSLHWKQLQAFGQHHYMTAATSFWEVLPFNHQHFLINITHKISQHKRNHLLERLPGRSKVLCTGMTQHQQTAWERIQQAALQLNKECVFTNTCWGLGPSSEIRVALVVHKLTPAQREGESTVWWQRIIIHVLQRTPAAPAGVIHGAPYGAQNQNQIPQIKQNLDKR